ncbi:uncharacterized protein EAF01_005848 [Botrytis porri]|uniref:uncharacterized protein n=1 Tax=Botrytis porri TaxID=87229 RepID=UPI0018FFCF77|nr:uncharacterized protein EAF01_005848 [Botrytis porri]KAF7905327.1 hypothetical protein EAF01_005848 [Botrytis porri]
MKVPEMRLSTWEALVPPPRRIHMQKSSMSSPDDRCWEYGCAESRDYFICEKGYTTLSCCLINPIYVNYSKDQLWFDSLSRLWSYARKSSHQDRRESRNGQTNEEVLQLSGLENLRLPELEEIIFELPKDRFED